MKTMTGRPWACIPACVLALSACVTGEEDDTGLAFRAADVNGGSAIEATGGSRPDVSSAQAASAILGILDEANLAHVSVEIRVDWEGDVRRYGGGTFSFDCNTADCGLDGRTFAPVMTKNGVRLAKSRYRREVHSDGGVGTELGYGGWMTHSMFRVLIDTTTYDGGSFVNGVEGYSEAGGNAPRTNPSTGPWVWNGVMVGRNTDIQSTSVSNVIQGDAAVSADQSPAGGMSVDVTFSNIKDLNSGRSMADMTWAGLSVSGGFFSDGSIRGSFYGPQHEEVAGVFERNSVLGAFGAHR